jgi:hypothetical protein
MHIADMTKWDWLMFYCAGVLLGIFCFAFQTGDFIHAPKTRFGWLYPLAGILGWPFLLPLSFSALAMSVFYLVGFYPGCRFILRLWRKLDKGATFTIRGRQYDFGLQ